jgi:hypothetical protein
MLFNLKKISGFIISLIILKVLIDSQYIRQAANYLLKIREANATVEIHIPIAQSSSNLSSTPPTYQNYDVVVYGDEVSGVCAAIWAQKSLGHKGKVALVRSNHASEPFGGVLTRGGLGYVDLDKISNWYSEPYAKCFVDFLDKAQVSEACLEVKTGSRALKIMLLEAGVKLISDSTPSCRQSKNRICRN